MSITVSATSSTPLAYRSMGPMPLHPSQSAFQALSVNALRRPVSEPAVEAPSPASAEPAVDHTTRGPELAEMLDFMMQQFVQQQCQKSPLAETKVDGVATESASDKPTEQRNYASHPHLMLAV